MRLISLESQIVQNCRHGNARSRFAIYANNRMAALRGALQKNFPTLVCYRGTEAIQPILREFCQHYPPESPYLVFYGEELVNFLREKKLWVEADLATLDRAWLSALMALDVDAVTPDEISGSEKIATLRLNPAFHIRPANRKNVALWHSLNHHNIKVEVPDASSQVDLLFYRDMAMRVNIMALTDPQSLFIECLLQGTTVELAAERIASTYPDFSLSEWFARLLVMGAFYHDHP